MTHGRSIPNPFYLKWKQLILSKAILLVILFLMMFSHIQAQNNWSQFRGPGVSGQITEATISDSYPEGGPELLWSLDIGSGFPEIAVFEDVAYVFSSDSLDGGYEYLAALKSETGEELWKTKVDSMWHEADGWGHGPRSTPAVDDKSVFCLSGFGKFCAIDKKNGKISWTVNVPEEFTSNTPRWGYSSSPILVDDVVILQTGGTKGRANTAFNKKNGKAVWSKGNSSSSYNTPLLATIDGQTQVIFAGDTMLTSYTPIGDELWTIKMPLRSPWAMPVFMAPNKIFTSSVSPTGSFIVEIKDNIPTQVSTSTTMQNNWSSSCYRDGYLYGFSKAKLQCVHAESGEMKWGKRGFGKGSLIMVGDKLLVLSDQGKLIIAEASPEAYTEIISSQVLEGKSWTAPAYADGKLFVRNLSKIACYKLSK